MKHINTLFTLVVVGLLLASVVSHFLFFEEGFITKGAAGEKIVSADETLNPETTPQYKEEDQARGEFSYQKTNMFDDEYVDPDDGKLARGPFVNSSVKIWNPQVVDDFLAFQMRQNPDLLFDMDIVQQQTSEEEAKELLKTGKWPWSERTQEIYQDVLARSQYIKRAGLKSMESDRTIYNEQAMLRILGLNEKEGQFLLFGKQIPNPDAAKENTGQGSYGINSGLVHPDIYKSNIRCAKGKLELSRFSGYNKGITGQAMFDTIPIHPEKLPELYKGFQYISEPCNPCVGAQFPYNNSCPFSIKADKSVSPAWEKIWGLPSTPIQKLPVDYTGWIN